MLAVVLMDTEQFMALTDPPLTRMAVSPGEAARMLGLGRTKFYELLAANEIASIKLGARRLIRVRDLEDWLARRGGEG